MKKKYLLILLFLIIPTMSFSGEWRDDGNAETPTGSDLINDLDTIIDGQIVQPLDRALAANIRGATLVYNTGVTIDISAGSLVCSNSAGDTRKMRLNTSSVSATFAGNLDTGAEAGSTTYYVYANCDAAATTFTVKISASSSAPSGVTSYVQLGNFFNDSSSDIDRTKIYTVGFGNIRADTNGAGLLTDIRDYASSTSSFTAKTGANLKIAFGTTPSISANSTSTITNLPFASASSYVCATNITGTSTSNFLTGCAVSRSSGSSFVCTNSNDESHTYLWQCLGT